MNKLRKVIALGTIALSASACNMPGHYWADGELHTVQLHAEWELEDINRQPWDIQPDMRLDIIMWPDRLEIYGENSRADKRCADMGGELIYYPRTDQFICEDIDY